MKFSSDFDDEDNEFHPPLWVDTNPTIKVVFGLVLCYNAPLTMVLVILVSSITGLLPSIVNQSRPKEQPNEQLNEQPTTYPPKPEEYVPLKFSAIRPIYLNPVPPSHVGSTLTEIKPRPLPRVGRTKDEIMKLAFSAKRHSGTQTRSSSRNAGVQADAPTEKPGNELVLYAPPPKSAKPVITVDDGKGNVRRIKPILKEPGQSKDRVKEVRFEVEPSYVEPVSTELVHGAVAQLSRTLGQAFSANSSANEGGSIFQVFKIALEELYKARTTFEAIQFPFGAQQTFNFNAEPHIFGASQSGTEPGPMDLDDPPLQTVVLEPYTWTEPVLAVPETQQVDGWSELVPAAPATQQPYDWTKLVPAAPATQQPYDWTKLVPAAPATRQPYDWSEIVPAAPATQQAPEVLFPKTLPAQVPKRASHGSCSKPEYQAYLVPINNIVNEKPKKRSSTGVSRASLAVHDPISTMEDVVFSGPSVTPVIQNEYKDTSVFEKVFGQDFGLLDQFFQWKHHLVNPPVVISVFEAAARLNMPTGITICDVDKCLDEIIAMAPKSEPVDGPELVDAEPKWQRRWRRNFEDPEAYDSLKDGGCKRGPCEERHQRRHAEPGRARDRGGEGKAHALPQRKANIAVSCR